MIEPLFKTHRQLVDGPRSIINFPEFLKKRPWRDAGEPVLSIQTFLDCLVWGVSVSLSRDLLDPLVDMENLYLWNNKALIYRGFLPCG